MSGTGCGRCSTPAAGIGNQLATGHIRAAKDLVRRWHISLEDPDLAYFVQGTVEFDTYIADMLWAQRYAMASRARMADALNATLFAAAGGGTEVRRINCHHNFTQRERHH